MNFACMDQFHTLWEKGQDRGMPIGGTQLFYCPQGTAAQEILHDLHQLLVAELLDAAQALGQDLAVAAVAAKGVVAPIQQIGLAYSGG